MGACTSKKVANQVNPHAIISKAELNQSAHEHLKNMLDADPLAASLNTSTFNSTFKKMTDKQPKTGAEARVIDQDQADFEGDGGRMHEPLWRAIESKDLTAATQFLNRNEIEEQNMYDSHGQSMLHKTAQLGYTDILMLLLERTGAKADLVNG